MNNKEIRLTEEEQIYLNDFVRYGEHKSKEIIRARVLLMLDRTGKTDMYVTSELPNMQEFLFSPCIICGMNFWQTMIFPHI